MTRGILRLIGCGTLIAAAGYLHAYPIAARAQQTSATDTSLRPALDRYCVSCHNTTLKTAGLLLDQLDATRVGASADAWEKVARKLRTREMPPAGLPRPDSATYDRLAST